MAKITVIDDDDVLLRMVGMMLERGGHQPTLISQPAQAMKSLKDSRPDIVVLDVMMPGVSGHDLCRQIRATPELADLPVLILTARSQEVDRTAALKSGATDYMSKPVTSQELLERVGRLLVEKPAASRVGQIVSLVGFRGGAGRTTLAVNLAGLLRRQRQAEVCLVDLSTNGGQAALHLRLATRPNWADLPAAASLDWATVEKALVSHPSGLRLLAAPAGLHPPDRPAADLVTTLLKLLKDSFGFVLVDLPPVLNPAAQAALAASDVVIQVVAPEVISVQNVVQSGRAVAKGAASARHLIVLNHCFANEPLPLATVERALNGRVDVSVGYDANQTRALAQGVPLSLTAAESPLPTDLGRLAENL
ncbi:MAG: response regulator [Chloroflexota bacterium]